jgi:hypothetical protein
MGNNTEGAGGAGLITTTARYEAARAQGTTATGWRQLARALNREADTAWTIGERQRFRALADDCTARADRLTAPKAVAA